MRSLSDSLVPRIHLLLAAAGLLPSLGAQCQLTWQPFSPLAGADDRVTCLATLASGDLVAGGPFDLVGSIHANHVARWDGVTWSPLGSGPFSWLPPGGGTVSALVALPNGDLLAGGGFGVERWNGTLWTSLGATLYGAAHALCQLPTGDVVAGGSFLTLNGQPCARIARWNGTTWSPLGSGVDNGEVRALALLTNGDIAVGGTFTAIGGTPMRALVVWNGTAFTSLGLASGAVDALQALPNGELLIGGSNLPGANLLRWNGATLVATTPPFTGSVAALRVEANGDWIVGGADAIPGRSSANVARYSNGVWTVLGTGTDTVYALGEHNGRLVAGNGPNTQSVINPTITSFDGVAWTPLGAPANALVEVLLADRIGGLFAGGRFAAIAGVRASNIARWDGTAWSPLGTGLDGGVTQLALAANGDVIAVGAFKQAGGVTVNRMARWDGTAWRSLQNAHIPNRVACGPSGEIVTLAWPRTVHVLAGGQWTTLPPIGAAASYDVIVTDPGTIVVSCTSNQTPAMSWDGQAWQPMGTGLMLAGRLDLDSLGEPMLVGAYWPGGTIILGGALPPVILGWNGSQWVPRAYLSGGIYDVLALPDGDLVAVGGFPVGMNNWGIARLHAGAWLSVDGGFSLPLGPLEPTARSIAVTRDGEVFVAGDFARSGSIVSARLAKATTNCPAVVTPVGAGCNGSAGPVGLAALDRPWLGATFHTEGTGFASAAFAIHAIGTPAAAAPLPLGAPGCTMHLAPFVLEPLQTGVGVVSTGLDVPVQQSLVGFGLRVQLFGVELGGTSLLLTSSNALDFTIGAL